MLINQQINQGGLKNNEPATASEGLGTYILGVNWEYLASHILHVPSSDDLHRSGIQNKEDYIKE